MLERTPEHSPQVVDQFINPIANTSMTVRDQLVRPSANPTTGAITITLPPVAEAKGRMYSILARDADATNDVTITDNDDTEYWVQDIVLDGPGQRVLLFSDGMVWHPFGGADGIPGVSTDIPAGATTAAPTTA